MAYNALVQHEQDVLSNSTDSPPISPQNYLHIMAFDNDRVPHSPLSERVDSVPLCHPTPDLQSLQGAYSGNIERLEQTAERLSESSDIGEELRKLTLEQRKSTSRGSSVSDTPASKEEELITYGNRQYSHTYSSHPTDSIVGTNGVARSGGFSPAGYYASPRSSIRSMSWSRNSRKAASVARESRRAQLQEPEQEREAHDSIVSGGFVRVSHPVSTPSKILRVRNDEEGAAASEGQQLPEVAPTGQLDPVGGVPDRPATAGSTDTNQQVDDLFDDFGGIHATPQAQIQPAADGALNDKSTAKHRTISGRPLSSIEPLPGEKTVYYPAPVPMMLNLPQKLSKQPPNSQRERRRLDLLGELPKTARKSASWLPDLFEEENGDPRLPGEELDTESADMKRKTLADLPPQLRASAFFDYPAARQEVEVKGESAVATLDSILDASAFAPVSAFTDHPIVGHVGAEVYGKPSSKGRIDKAPAEQVLNSKRRSSPNVLRKRVSASNVLSEGKARNHSLPSLNQTPKHDTGHSRAVSSPLMPDEAGVASLHSEGTPLRADELPNPLQVRGDPADGPGYHDAEGFEVDVENREDGNADQYNGQPTTLLAELQLRKAQQKQRNRTAANAFPNGMHSTLLELDAVANVQRQTRKQKHVTLAWEDPNIHQINAENADDEDIPLGMLFPGQHAPNNTRLSRFEEDRPLGLIAKREMEDNEPLSQRRARLRGEDPIRQPPSPERGASMYTLDLPGLANDRDDAPEVEDEVLAHRAKRLRNQSGNLQSRPLSSDFASEMMSQFGALSPEKPPNGKPVPSKTPELEEETLAERRKRLRAEREAAKSREVSSGSGRAGKPALTNRHSMVDLLQAHPTARAHPPSGHQTQWALKQQEQAPSSYLAMVTGLSLLGNPQGAVTRDVGTEAFPAASTAMAGSANEMINPYPPPPTTNGFPPFHATPGTQALYPNPMVYNRGVLGGPLEGAVEAMGSRQREMIDRWRQSIL